MVKEAFVDTGRRIKLPLISLAGALIMVNFMMLGGTNSPHIFLSLVLSQALPVITGLILRLSLAH